MLFFTHIINYFFRISSKNGTRSASVRRSLVRRLSLSMEHWESLSQSGLGTLLVCLWMPSVWTMVSSSVAPGDGPS